MCLELQAFLSMTGGGCCTRRCGKRNDYRESSIELSLRSPVFLEGGYASCDMHEGGTNIGKGTVNRNPSSRRGCFMQCFRSGKLTKNKKLEKS